MAIPVLTVSALILSKMKSKVIDSFLGFFGKYSLEIYLWNIFLIQIIEYFGIKEWLEKYVDSSGYLTYSLVIVGGILLSILYGKIQKLLFKG